MLAFIQGKVVSVDQQIVVVQAGGLGISVAVARSEFFAQGQEVTLPIYMHWNQEQGPSVFGFQTEAEKMVFLLIISCSGMGPKIGLALLSALSPADFFTAIQEGNEKALSSVSGIGPKKAEQMVVQLRQKVSKLIESGVGSQMQGATKLEEWKNVTQVLQSLNYSRPEVDAALNYLRKEYGGSACTFDELLRASLSFLAKRV